jgi:hypothetical protein
MGSGKLGVETRLGSKDMGSAHRFFQSDEFLFNIDSTILVIIEMRIGNTGIT